ncbi:MAG: hypothetical protein AAB774_02355 [Patescibacteria group bacterium]
MSKNIVIIGDSPLSSLIACQLDRQLAREAHIEITHISRDESFVYLPCLTSLIGQYHLPAKKELYQEVTFTKATIRQINLIDRRVITTAGTYEYDVLVIDQTPTFTGLEIKKISALCLRLVTQLQSKIKSGHQLKARLTFAGDDVSSWQLALALAGDVSKLSSGLRRSLVIQAQFPLWDWLKKFLSDNSVESRKTVGLLPGATVAGAKPPFENRLVRGALLDDADNFILDPSLNPERYPEVIVVDRIKRFYQNNLRVDQTLAVKISQNISRYLEGRRQQTIELPPMSGLLRTDENMAAWVGGLQDKRFKARIIGRLDLAFYRRLFRLHS